MSEASAVVNTLRIARWAPPEADAPACFACAGQAADTLLASASEADLRQHLQTRPGRVFIGDAALDDSTLIKRLVAEFGGERIGVWLDTAPMSVRWALETESNADFRTVTPSMPEPCWEILASNGERTGTRADWWIGEMLARGACAALVRADLDRQGAQRDRDLNICAGLTEHYGEQLWLTPANANTCDLGDWTCYGHASRFVLPADWPDSGLSEPETNEAPAHA